MSFVYHIWVGKKYSPLIRIIRKCSCNNEFQDKLYGKKIRMMNQKAGKLGGYRCTVCRAVYTWKKPIAPLAGRLKKAEANLERRLNKWKNYKK